MKQTTTTTKTETENTHSKPQNTSKVNAVAQQTFLKLKKIQEPNIYKMVKKGIVCWVVLHIHHKHDIKITLHTRTTTNKIDSLTYS